MIVRALIVITLIVCGAFGALTRKTVLLKKRALWMR
jgi:hypothetical protein